MTVEYTVAMCNYNMGDTIEQALRSVLDQVDDRFEVLVVDDGSTDDSVPTVRSLQTEYDALRLVELPYDPGRQLGITRNVSVRQARGDHVLVQIDADDVYDPVIPDFVTVYEQFRSGLDRDILFKSSSLTVAPRSFLLDRGPYRNLPVGAEDTDMWLRFLADEAVVWLDSRSPKTEISSPSGPLSTLRSKACRGLAVRVGEYQVGYDPVARLHWNHKKWRRGERSTIEYLFEYLATPYALTTARFRSSYDPAYPQRSPAGFERAISELVMPLVEAESLYGVSVDRDALSDAGRALFYDGRTEMSTS